MADMHQAESQREDFISDRAGDGPRQERHEISYFRPLDALPILSEDLEAGSPKFEKLKATLGELPGFLRIDFESLQGISARFENVINITGFSGQGVHPGQRELLEHAYGAILADKGWTRETTLIISGGTALGIPHSAVPSLNSRFGYTAIGIMALPGVAYPISTGYSAICVENAWKKWGDEMEPMSKVSTGTILAGGGVQALGDALKSLAQGEKIAVIVNAFNGLSRVEYRSGLEKGDAILPGELLPPRTRLAASLAEVETGVKEWLRAKGKTEEELIQTHITSLPVNGLVTEIRDGKRRPCGQDLLYFAVTGIADLLPAEFRPATEEGVEDLRRDLVANLDLYYLLDDPHEGITGSSVIKLNSALTRKHEGVLHQVIDHAVEHDVWNPASGHFGPPQLRARSREDLAQLLKRELHYQLNRNDSLRAAA